MRYYVYDGCGHLVRGDFRDLKAASTYKACCGNSNWRIIFK